MKKCPRCKIVKEVELFSKNKSKKDGLGSYCRDCQRLYNKRMYPRYVLRSKEYYLQNKNTYLVRQKQRREELKKDGKWYNVKLRYRRYLSVAKSKKIEFKLSLEDFAMLTSQPCFYCGGFNTGFNFTGLDKVIPNLGYTISNIVPCCFRCNEMKFHYPKDSFLTHVAQIYNYLNLN